MTRTLKEQIIKAVQDATDIVDGTVSIPILDHFLDGILNEQLRQLDVPSLKEQNDEANNYGEINKTDYGVKENASWDFIHGAEWMLLEIIKRNKK